jgi:signal transduction histidine kinase
MKGCSDVPDLGRAWIGKQRRLIFFALALFIPVLVLTGLSLAAIRNDRVSFEWVQVTEQRDLLEQVHSSLNDIVAEAKDKIFQRLQPTPSRLAKASTFFEELKRLEREMPIVRGFFVVDARHKMLYPQSSWPYQSNPETQKLGEIAKLARLQRIADRSRVQTAIMAVRNDRFLSNIERVFAMKTMATDEAPGSEPWAILLYAEAEGTLTLGRPKEARAQFDSVGKCKRPILLHDGRPLRVEAILRAAALHPPETGFKLVSELLCNILANQYTEIPKARFKEYLTHGKELLEEIGQALPTKYQEEAKGILAQVERFETRLTWWEALDGDLRTYLSTLSADPSPSGDWVRRITRVGDKPLLICYRACAAENSQSHVFIGFQIDLEVFAETVLQFKFQEFPIERGLAFAIQDSKGHVLVSKGKERALRNQELPLLSKRSQALPFWRITVRRNPNAIARSATQRSLLLAGLIALALVGVAFGALSTFRFVNQSLELARLKSDFMSSITHELKTPLTSIQMFAEMLSLGRIKNDEKRMEYYKYIGSESIRLRRMIDDILDFACSESGKVHYVLAEADFVAVVLDALDIFRLSAEAEGFEIAAKLPEFRELPPVNVDREAMVRVFVNLLSNAVKYSIENPDIVVTVQREGTRLLASVADKGVGIESGNLEKIFDKFFRAGDPLTREVSGTGLGLSLVHGIVTAHRGEIDVSSEKNVGSTFTVYLPIVEEYRAQWPPVEAEATQSDFVDSLSSEESANSSQVSSGDETASAVEEKGA